MQYTLFLFLVFFSLSSYCQVYVYTTTNPNVGFGISSDCQNNSSLGFVVNGPLVHSSGKPVGGYIDNGVQKQPWTNPKTGGGNFEIDNSIFGLAADGTFRLVEYDKRHRLPAMRWAIQNGIPLVIDRQNVRGNSDSKYVRSGIGSRHDGTVVVIVCLTPITFRDFAELFVKEGCQHAIYLDGTGNYVGFSDKSGSYGNLNPHATKLQFFTN